MTLPIRNAERHLANLEKVPNGTSQPTGWTEVVRRRTGNNNTNNKVKNVTVGTLNAANIIIKPMEKRAHLHLLHLHPKTTDEDVKAHLRSLKLDDVNVFKINSKSPENYSSFRLTMPFELLERVNSPSNWPSGCKLQRFRFFHTPKTINQVT